MSLLLKVMMIPVLLLWQSTAFLPVSEEKPVLLMNATAHLGSGQLIDNAAVAFENGKFTLIADATRIRLDMTAFEVIHLYGKHVYAATVAGKDSLRTDSSGYYISQGSLELVIDLSAHGLKERTEATFLVTDCPIKEGRGAEVLMAYVKGEKIMLQNRHLKSLK